MLTVLAFVLARQTVFPWPAAAEEPAGLSLADLAAYRAAIDGKPAGSAVAVTFRDLWDHPERYQGRRVRVEGRVARRFRQGKFGTFPPLVESWAVNPAGDPFCLVYPAPTGDETVKKAADPAPGASVRFEGVYLKRLQYQGGDAARLAPLVVGDRPPAVTSPAPLKAKAEPVGGGFSWGEWAIGLTVAALVALALARRHLGGGPRRPGRRERDDEPPPDFLDDP